MVWPMRNGSAGRALAFPRKRGTRRYSMSGLRQAHRRPDVRRERPGNRSAIVGRIFDVSICKMEGGNWRI